MLSEPYRKEAFALSGRQTHTHYTTGVPLRSAPGLCAHWAFSPQTVIVECNSKFQMSHIYFFYGKGNM